MKLIYKIIGICSFVTGLVGVFVPLLPTTCFILLAVWCFSKSSPQWYQALKQNQLFGNTVSEWENNRTIPLTAKRIALSSMLLSAAFCLITFDNGLLKIIAILSICIGMWFVNHIPTRQQAI